MLLFQSGVSLDELGRKMGYENHTRKSAWQFLNKTSDPRLSMLLKFASAIGIDVVELMSDGTPHRHS